MKTNSQNLRISLFCVEHRHVDFTNQYFVLMDSYSTKLEVIKLLFFENFLSFYLFTVLDGSYIYLLYYLSLFETFYFFVWQLEIKLWFPEALVDQLP